MIKWIKSKLLTFTIAYILDYVKGGNKMFEKIRNLLSGKKTYLIALGAIIGVLVSFSNGSVEVVEAIKLIIEAILACTIRAGVSKK